MMENTLTKHFYLIGFSAHSIREKCQILLLSAHHANDKTDYEDSGMPDPVVRSIA
jgi:hypothetical protein